MTNYETFAKENVSAAGARTTSGPDVERTTPRRRWWPLLVAPYVAGLAWHGLHPVASVFTGDLNRPRGSYIDENSLDPNHFQRTVRYPVMATPQASTPRDAAGAAITASSLCEALRSTSGGSGIDCTRRRGLEVATVVPSGTAVAPVAEALAVVLPPPVAGDWLGSQLHASVAQLVVRLAAPERAPWLAKTVFFVAPSSAGSNLTLHDTVGRFLDMNSGKSSAGFAGLKGPIVRNLLVLDITTTSAISKPEIQILPQGRNGILPNMDLVFLCSHVYRRGIFPNLAMSPYRAVATAWFTQHIAPRLPVALSDYAKKLLELLSFEYALLAGPTLPHAPALDRGIDALTIRLADDGRRTGRDGAATDTAAALLVTGLDYILRALSNLHERLHHSTSLYLLAAPEAFVKHEEYLVPTLLLLVPCILRAVTLAFVDLRRFHPAAAGRALRYVLGCTLVVSTVGLPFLLDPSSGEADGPNGGADAWLWFGGSAGSADLAFALIVGSYLPLVWWSSCPKVAPPDAMGCDAASADAIQTMQFLGCLLVVYTHVAMAFGHVALAFPSALVWTPLLAWPRYGALSRSARQGLFMATCTAALWLFRSGALAYGSGYARYISLPLHWVVAVVTMSN